ncbi:MAG: DNA methyltransferase family protein [Rhodospirillales bacterium]
MATTEPTINDALADILRGTKRAWSSEGVINSENTQTIRGSQAKPDILILGPHVFPVVIETEVLPAATVEPEARGRLGHELTTTGQPILASIAVRLPNRLRSKSGKGLREELTAADDFEYALFTGKNPDDCERWPSVGWLSGSHKDISVLAQSASVPPMLIEAAADNFVEGVSQAAGILDQIAATHPLALKKIAAFLYQEDGTQTRRMAATILSDAFVFHASLAGASDELKDIRSLDQLRGDDDLRKSQVLGEWRKILKVNYWPIFDISRRIFEVVPSPLSRPLVLKLAETAERLIEKQLMRSHDLTGEVFQKLISDRKFLAAYYTTPASAALMAGLILPESENLPGGAWGDDNSLTSLKIADFACGTGTLLSTLYHRLGMIHELHGGDSESIHPDMMGKVLVGCDILPGAAHLTASMLSGAHPTVIYHDSNIMTMPYGRQEDNSVALGSLDLLDPQRHIEILAVTAQKIEGKGASESEGWMDLPDDSIDVVAMNPPFTRATGHEGEKVGVPVPMFAAFASTEEEQRQMSKATKRLAKNTCYHGNAGEGSIFVALGDRKLKAAGKMGLILPLSTVTGDAWEQTRNLLRKSYSNLIVLSVIGADHDSMSFSADTGMGECMIIGQKTASKNKRAVFVAFDKSPAFPMLGANAAKSITESLAKDSIAKLEDGPNGGTDVKFGDDKIGVMIDAPLPEKGGWNIARIADMSLAQTAYQMIHQSRAWLPTMAEDNAVAVPISAVEKQAERGPYHSDISGKTSKGGVRGPFEIKKTAGNSVPTYPCLWEHEAGRERTMKFDAAQEAVPLTPRNSEEKNVIKHKVQSVWATASHLHFNQNFQFNSQSTAVQFSPRKTLGGRAWLAVNFNDERLEKAACLWGNCTLGLLLHWYWANKQQSGRGNISKNLLATLPFLDVRGLSAAQIDTAAGIFDEFSDMEMRPLNEMDADPQRAELDRRFLIECLGFPKELLAAGEAVEILRAKLAHEPSIKGGKSRAD